MVFFVAFNIQGHIATVSFPYPYVTWVCLADPSFITSTPYTLPMPVTDNCPTLNSGRRLIAVINISWQITTWKCPPPGNRTRTASVQILPATDWANRAGYLHSNVISMSRPGDIVTRIHDFYIIATMNVYSYRRVIGLCLVLSVMTSGEDIPRTSLNDRMF